MKKIFLISIAILFTICGFTLGQKKNLTMEDAMLGYYKFRPENIDKAYWIPNSQSFSYVKDSSLFINEVTKKSTSELISLSDINKALKAKQINKIKSFPNYKWISTEATSFFAHNNKILFNTTSKSIYSINKTDDNWENLDFFESNNNVAYTIDNNVYINGKAITTNTDKNIVSGQAVSRSEFGIEKGTFWSPNGNYLAFYQKDETNVTVYPLVDVTKRVAEANLIKYPMAGMKSEKVRLGIYNVKSKSTIFIENNPESEEYLTNISWGPNEEYIYVSVINREQNHTWLNKYSAKNGKLVKTLLEETSKTWTEPENTLYFMPNNAKQFIYQSERDGYKHLYLYTTEGKLIRQLTKGNWVVTNLFGADSKGKQIYFESTKDSPLDRHLYKVSVSSGKITKITKEEGYHNIQLNTDKTLFIDNYSNLKTPRIINICNTKGKVIENIITAEDKYNEFDLGEIKLGKVLGKDGKTDLYYRMILPTNFDPTKKYPVIVYVYGGPHSQLVMNNFMGGTRMWQQYMAERGYIAFTLDNRGTNYRGKEFESAIHRQLGTPEVEDQMCGVEYLMSLPYVDTDRIGVHGWSYGGFMTISMLLKHNDIFKVAVAGGPVIDWKYYEIMYGERYMDMPQENPEGYEKSSLLNQVDNLKGRLMIIHGAQDPTVVWQHSQLFVEECIKKGKLIDYNFYPTHPHNVRGKDRVHLMNTVSRYFEDHL